MTEFGTIGSVALRIIEDFGEKRIRHGLRMNRYTLWQILQKVVEHRESVESCSNDVPSYIWWHLGVSDEGEIVPVISHGAMAKKKTIWLDKRQREYRWVWPYETSREEGPWRAALGVEVGYWGHDPEYYMMRLGLSFGQKVLSRTVGYSSPPSYCNEDGDSGYETEILYIEPCPVIDIPLRLENRKPEFKSLSVI